MLKKVIFAAVATGFVGAIALPLEVTPAAAATTCKELAKMKYPGNWTGRRAWIRECRGAVRNDTVRAGFSVRNWQACGYCDHNAPGDWNAPRY